MANHVLGDIYGAGLTLIPHVEMGAIAWITRKYALASRVRKFTDMRDWNVRKWSEYGKYERAVELAEATAIPTTKLLRKRKNEIEPKEVGHRYVITDRRISTDLENIVADSIRALGTGIGDRLEADLMDVASNDFIGGATGDASTTFSLDLAVSLQYEFAHEARREPLVHVIHPLQAKTVMTTLLQSTGANAGVNLDYRNRAINSWTLPGFDGLEIVVSEFMPRRIVNKLAVYGTGGTFKLALFGGRTQGENLTAAITVSATPATTVANIKAALEALTFSTATGYPYSNGTWTVSGAANNDITITPPTGIYLDKDSELRLGSAVDTADLAGEKSSADAVTGISGSTLDVNGLTFGVRIFERSASAKSLLFARDAIMWDERVGVKAHFNPGDSYQGRVVEYSAYTVYGVGPYRPELGMTIEAKAETAFKVT